MAEVKEDSTRQEIRACAWQPPGQERETTMPSTIRPEDFTKALFGILDETFESHHGIFTDKGTSLFETLDTITAAQASRPVFTGYSIAAQVAHVTLYLDVLERWIRTQQNEHVEWEEIWRTVREVTPDEWVASLADLKRAHQALLATLRGIEVWEEDPAIAGTLAVLAHTAYHLGAIRQALYVVQSAESA